MAQFFNILQVNNFIDDIFNWNFDYLIVFQFNAAILYPMALALGAEALVSIKRIEEYLLKNEKSETDLGLERRSSLIASSSKGTLNQLKNKNNVASSIRFVNSIRKYN